MASVLHENEIGEGHHRRSALNDIIWKFIGTKQMEALADFPKLVVVIWALLVQRASAEISSNAIGLAFIPGDGNDRSVLS